MTPEEAVAPAADRGADPRRWAILAVIAACQLMLVLDSSIVTIALPQAQHDLGISDADRQWVVAAYAVAFGGLLLLGGRIADFAGRKRVFVIGLIGFAIASAIGGLEVCEPSPIPPHYGQSKNHDLDAARIARSL